MPSLSKLQTRRYLTGLLDPFEESTASHKGEFDRRRSREFRDAADLLWRRTRPDMQISRIRLRTGLHALAQPRAAGIQWLVAVREPFLCVAPLGL
jgi:hypothetical protein